MQDLFFHCIIAILLDLQVVPATEQKAAVSSVVKAAAPVTKPPVFELQGKKWAVV
jgi:hypothetical protein